MSQLGSTPATFALPGGIVFFLAWLIIRSMTPSKKSFPFPPSPPSTRLLGHDVVPWKNPFLKVASWIDEYGPLISLRTGTTKYVIIGRHKASAAIEIMEKQGGLLVDRPRFVAAGELLGGGLRILLTPSGERLRKMRRALHTHLQPKVAQTYESLQMLHAKDTILDLLETPEQYQDHARTYAASVVLKVAYGKSTPTHATDPDILEVRKSLDRFRIALQPGSYLVDIFPFLKYLPWYGRELRKGLLEDCSLFRRQLDAVKRDMNSPDAGPSFGKFLLKREIDFGLTETEMAFLAGGFFSAGSDTTALSICIAMITAARHPEAQAMVHAELDEVVGNHRVPTFDDDESLPVLRAFILESMRWRPLVPMGLPHRATEDIIWGGYCIPAGTTVYGNHWAISRDPEVFPDPEKFNLTRWLTSEGKLRDDLKFPYFGFGRRVCPGQHVASRSVFINTLLVLWSFRLSLDTSKPVNDMAFMTSVMPDVQPCSLNFEPRIAKEELKAMMQRYPNAA
ncbi:cytochrome P450 [Gyrodon lividus]|nr:cytochrome P450 [Gyrodon lividus]